MRNLPSIRAHSAEPAFNMPRARRPKNAGDTSVVDIRDPWPTGSCGSRPLPGLSLCMPPLPEKRKNTEFEVRPLWNVGCFHTTAKANHPEARHPEPGTSARPHFTAAGGGRGAQAHARSSLPDLSLPAAACAARRPPRMRTSVLLPTARRPGLTPGPRPLPRASGTRNFQQCCRFIFSTPCETARRPTRCARKNWTPKRHAFVKSF